MSEKKDLPEFRLYYFTNRYPETVSFYRDLLQWGEFTSWDRGDLEKGTIFRSPNGIGLIEIEEGTEAPILQAGLYIQVENIDVVYENAINQKIKIVEPLSNTSYGHRVFKIEDPNGLIIGFFKHIPISF